MRRTGLTIGALAAALTFTGFAGPTAAQPEAPPGLDRERLREAPGQLSRAPEAAKGPATRKAKADTAAPPLAAPLTMPTSYPAQPSLRIYPHGLPDQADTANLLGYDDIAPQLNAWMSRSDRISTQVIGRSTQGRDLYLVTVTAPETRRETRQQAAWRQKIRNNPRAAAGDRALQRGYKTPIWFSGNIHGNEWEGTDAAMGYLRRLVDAPPAQVRDLLAKHRLYFSLTLNPDGRTLGTRATALGLNENRDMITNVTPEAQSYVRTAQAVQPLLAADLHGYTDVLQVEPCGPPHGENYEYDLFIPHGYALARRVEDDVVAANIPGNPYYNVETGEVVPENTGPETSHIIIPYRDTPSGWDDFPPIFTAQYAAFSGAVTSTVELPLSRPNSNSQTPANGVVNTAVGLQTITSMVDYVSENSDAMLADQIEFFRRGVAGGPKSALTTANIADVPGPAEWKQHWDPVDDQDPVAMPRAYVIPVGATQRSRSDAFRLVEQLQFHDVEVGVLSRPARVGSTTYPAGSFVVDMHQPRRGLANSLLDKGSDISAKVPVMYDISAWSYSYLWGASVAKVGSTTDAALGTTRDVRARDLRGDVPGRGWLTFDLAGVGDYRALNELLEVGAPVSMLADGSAAVGPDGYRAVRRVADQFAIDFDRATTAERRELVGGEAKELDDLVVGYAGGPDDLLSLTELGFDDIVEVSAARLTENPGLLDDLDVLWVGGSLRFSASQAAAREALAAWVAQGHSVVGSGAGAFELASGLGLVSATAVAGNRGGNGIVAVTTPPRSLLAPYSQGSSFIYPSVAFTSLGEGTTAQQSYAAGNPLLAGHWAPSTGSDGPTAAGGLASVIAGRSTTSGAKAVIFGTSVFFRVHVKGGMSQGARALFWVS